MTPLKPGISTGVTKRAIVVQRRDIPERTRAFGAMAEPDYIDRFTVTTSEKTTAAAEDWARVALEGASPAARFLVWQVLCGLRLHKQPSREHVAGWKVGERGDTWVRLEATSWFMTAHAVIEVGDRQLSVALLVRYDRRPVGALIWPFIADAHRRAMPGLLRHAVRRMEVSS